MTEQNQKTIKTVLIIVVLLIAGYFLYEKTNFLNIKPKQEKQELKPVITPKITRIEEESLQKEMPQGFSSEVPLNGKTKIIESYSATYPNSKAKQSTITFESKNTPKQNYDFYLKWGKENKWETVSQTNNETIKSLYLRKNNKDLNIVITNKITITYVEV